MLELVLNLFFPPVCGICGKENVNWLCDKCYLQLIKEVNCLKYSDKSYEEMCYIFRYKNIRNELLSYKFFEKSYLKNMFVTIILKEKILCDKLKLYDIIIPVPMTKGKKLQRGYNQTELISKDLAKKINLNYNEKVLKKIKNNKRQSSLNKEEREQNVKNVFCVIDSNFVKNKNVILFDDIVTTGLTVEACCKELKNAGAKRILVLAIAKD